ncbi:TetR/AcrR family transcriptional regulator [Campylobacter sp. faydin G-24]|uniref:TetR/AcrR family transcriptional regulator n=1 Tax=Campylobacter anatolicus TaxID=2829105 RepID=A0ABS5HG38_9BACT|nr:TetR/AcrR family transcriptional regulator [Campylobacter anatolicus]MBR8462303.1 TetR/AcrR family transcriptional regulator [Campylobacter anatolicus]MBR8463244.1 TetR/AcrR family transcriptional regulator [Campylobacter anatolicus]
MGISEKGKKRYETIMNVGLELFLKKGYENTSLNDIVSKGGGSLASIYKFFKNKDGLFIAIIQENMDNVLKDLDEKMNMQISNDLEEILFRFGMIYLDLFCQKDSIALSRLVLSECYKSKDLCENFTTNIVGRTCKILTNYLQRDDIRPKLKNYDLNIIALKFCALVREPYHLDAVILGKEIKMDEKQKEENVRKVVDLFLHGIYR